MSADFCFIIVCFMSLCFAIGFAFGEKRGEKKIIEKPVGIQEHDIHCPHCGGAIHIVIQTTEPMRLPQSAFEWTERSEDGEIH